jgi:hypothetical protein
MGSLLSMTSVLKGAAVLGRLHVLLVVMHVLAASEAWAQRRPPEVAAARILVVRREDDPTTVGREEGGEVGTPELRDLTLIGAVRVHHPELHPIRAHETLRQQVPILRERRVGRMPRAIHDQSAVGREERAAVVARRRRQPTHVRPVDIHCIDVEVTILERREYDRASIGQWTHLDLVRDPLPHWRNTKMGGSDERNRGATSNRSGQVRTFVAEAVAVWGVPLESRDVYGRGFVDRNVLGRAAEEAVVADL